MAVNLESHGLPAVTPYGASVSVQDHQGQGHGQQQPAQDAGYSAASEFELAAGASVPQPAVEDQESAAGGDLLSRLGGFIRAVGDVLVQLGEYIKSAAGDEVAPEAAPAPQAGPAAAPALGSAAGAPVATGPGGQPALAGAPGQPVTATALQAQPLAAQPRQTSPALGARSAEPTQRDAAKVAAAGLGVATASLSVATAGLRGGARSSQSSGFPVLNPLPPYLGDQIAPLFTFDDAPQINAAAEVSEAAYAGYTDNVIPFPGPASSFQGEASNDSTAAAEAQAEAEADPTSGRYSAMVFRPAFYGNLRC